MNGIVFYLEIIAKLVRKVFYLQENFILVYYLPKLPPIDVFLALSIDVAVLDSVDDKDDS